MKNIVIVTLSLITMHISSCAQISSDRVNKPVSSDVNISNDCEGCLAVYESPVAFTDLKELAWLPDWDKKGTRLGINGIVYNKDGSPAKDVILYIYHTDQTGHYPMKGNETGWAKQHGYLRAWMKTNEKGEYKFFTLRPASYPGRSDPAHIHMAVKEPGKTPYWVDDIVFEDDPLVTEKYRRVVRDQGGSGILEIHPRYEGRDSLKAERHIYLGKNIDGYPENNKTIKK